MSARRYYDRINTYRLVWSCVMAFIYLLYLARAGFDLDVTIFLAIIWLAGFPRNMAKHYARKERRLNDLDDAIAEEMQRRASQR